MKHTIDCLGFRPFPKNTLIGFAKVRAPELQLTINDVALQRGESKWAQLPARPQINKDGTAVADPKTGKTAYFPLLQFETKAASDAFSAAVWNACAECMREAAA